MRILRALAWATLVATAFSACSGEASHSNKAKKSDGGDPWAEDETETWPGDYDCFEDCEDEGDEGNRTIAVKDGGTLSVPEAAAPPEAGPKPKPTGGPTILYSAPLPVGIDHRINVEAALDSEHALSGYVHDALEMPLRGSLATSEIAWRSGANGQSTWFLGIGRWHGGRSAGRFYGVSIDVNDQQGFHYAVGIGTEVMPTGGEADYHVSSLGGMTVPTSDDGTAGVAIPSVPKARAHFGARSQIALTFGLNVGGSTYTIATKGGLAAPSSSEIAVLSDAAEAHVFGGVVPVESEGAACGGSCVAIVRGFFAGPNAEQLVVAYAIGSGSSKALRGVTVFEK